MCKKYVLDFMAFYEQIYIEYIYRPQLLNNYVEDVCQKNDIET